MLITYFDEVKYQQGSQPYYWLAGISASATTIWELESKVAELSQEYFGSPALTRDTEFHAAEIFHRKRNFKQWWDIGSRVQVINRLASILNEAEGVGKIYVRIDPSKMIADDYEQKAFIFFVERVEMHLNAHKQPGLLIGDRENEKVSGAFAETLSKYRFDGTPYQFGRKLEFLIDTVHFTDSHHSRMLQLADLYV